MDFEIHDSNGRHIGTIKPAGGGSGGGGIIIIIAALVILFLIFRDKIPEQMANMWDTKNGEFFAILVPSLFHILFSIICTIIQRGPYNPDDVGGFWELTFSSALVGMIIYAINLSAILVFSIVLYGDESSFTDVLLRLLGVVMLGISYLATYLIFMLGISVVFGIINSAVQLKKK